jgi:hypothetical protein
MNRNLRRAAWVLVVLILVGIIAWTTLNVIGSSRLSSAMESAESAGYAIRADKLHLPVAPPGENAAPYYSAAFALYVAPEDEEPAWDRGPDIRIGDLEPADLARMEAWLKRNEDAFDMVQRARKRPRCRYERDYRQGFAMLLPEVTKVLALCRALAWRAELQMSKGDAAGARESVRSMFDLGHSLREDALLVSHLVRLAAAERALEVIGRSVTASTGAADLKDWRAAVPGPSMLDGGLERAYRGELAIAAGLANRPASELADLTGGESDSLGVWLLKPLIRLDGAAYLKDMRKVIDAARKPYLEARAEGVMSEAPRSPLWNPVRFALFPSLARSLDREAHVRARLAIARAALDAELEQRTSGAYPDRTAETDPFSGKPLSIDGKKVSSAGPPASKFGGEAPLEWILRPAKK